jgi:adenine deaminase
LISPWPLEQVVRRHEKLLRAARQLGCSLADPFVVLSFLALPVIPELKVTDLGLVDVRGFRKVSLFKE